MILKLYRNKSFISVKSLFLFMAFLPFVIIDEARALVPYSLL